jgi:hypothetical protein
VFWFSRSWQFLLCCELSNQLRTGLTAFPF